MARWQRKNSFGHDGSQLQQKEIVLQLEKEIHELETQQAELTTALENPESYQQPGRATQINRELSSVMERLAAATAEWETAANKLAALEADQHHRTLKPS